MKEKDGKKLNILSVPEDTEDLGDPLSATHIYR